MPEIRHKVNGGVATVSEKSVEKLVASGQWELVDGEKPAPKRTARRAAAKTEDKPAEE